LGQIGAVLSGDSCYDCFLSVVHVYFPATILHRN
jgi:hypothetical protein